MFRGYSYLYIFVLVVLSTGSAWEVIQNAGDQTHGGHVQGKNPPCSTIIVVIPPIPLHLLISIVIQGQEFFIVSYYLFLCLVLRQYTDEWNQSVFILLPLPSLVEPNLLNSTRNSCKHHHFIFLSSYSLSLGVNRSTTLSPFPCYQTAESFFIPNAGLCAAMNPNVLLKTRRNYSVFSTTFLFGRHKTQR